ncbi:hypothetical protein RZS08_10010, partial [Arthrospira platensis SPKY1]|nr:hypothetical protein [Arthrospira platensis SPKY1]
RLGQASQQPMFDQRQIAPAQPGHPHGRFQVGHRRGGQLPDFPLGIRPSAPLDAQLVAGQPCGRRAHAASSPRALA